MKKIMLNTLFIILTCILAACNLIPSALFQDDICESPCWKGITPGKTTLQEVKAKLQTFAEVDSASIEERTILNADDSIIFKFRPNFREVGGYVFSQEKIIEGIWFGYDTGKLKLSEVLQRLGIPDQYISIYNVGAEAPSLVTSIIYIKRGVILSAITAKGIGEVPKFGNDFPIESIWYINPENTKEFLQNGPIDRLDSQELTDGLKPWTGLGEIIYLTKDH